MTTTSTTSIAVDFMTKTITVSRTFLKASRKIGSPEFLILKQLTEEMPSFSIALRAKTICHKIFQPSYEWMRNYIEMQPDAQEAIDEFMNVRSLYRHYSHVRAWFMDKYPNAERPEDLYKVEMMAA